MPRLYISTLLAFDTYIPPTKGHKKTAKATHSLITHTQTLLAMPTAHDIKTKNARFAQNARAGKTAPRPSYRDRLAKKSPLGYTALTAIVFVVCGGVLFELARLFFL
ncbi:unnamed protein product [Rhizoctonia solani]|uniref:Stress-associated endoplasmic reticulum protein n=1 Tax=Rhizoctonia solani TaxID=456999 RepID=A0A8H3DEG2_9AGAM|nr:unnamed protein product [Rhizoctonia solani]